MSDQITELVDRVRRIETKLHKVADVLNKDLDDYDFRVGFSDEHGELTLLLPSTDVPFSAIKRFAEKTALEHPEHIVDDMVIKFIIFDDPQDNPASYASIVLSRDVVEVAKGVKQ